MSFDRVTPTYYQTFQQGTPFEAGAPGWSTAPWVTWGNNPNLGGRRRLATDGLGSVVAISGLGDAAAPTTLTYSLGSPLPAWRRALGLVGAAACAYHGYRRNDSAGWAVGWAFFGSAAPILALPIALAQGFGKPASRAALTPNRRRRSRRQ